MRKFIVITLFGILSIGFHSVNAQKNVPENLVPKNLGQFFVFLNNTYEVTLNDVVEISKSIGGMKENVAYNLKNGQVFFVYSPEKWIELMTKILSKVKRSPITSIGDELAKGNITNWDDNISIGTINYAVTKGKVWVVSKDYHGGKGVKVLVYEGYPVLKVATSCLNPNEPEVPEIASIPLPVVPVAPVIAVKKVDTLPTPKEDELKIPIPKDEKKDGCCCEGKYSIEEIKKLFELFKEAQIKQEAPQQQGNWMVLTPQSNDDDYNWRAKNRRSRLSLEDIVDRFFITMNFSFGEREAYRPYLLRTMSQGIDAGNGNGNSGVGGVRRTMSYGLGG